MIRLAIVGVALALAACGADKAEAPEPDNVVVIDNGTLVEQPTPAQIKICERQPWKCEQPDPPVNHQN